MKLATLCDGTRDGRLVVVSQNLEWCSYVKGGFNTLQSAIDDWDNASQFIVEAEKKLEDKNARIPFIQSQALSPLPRAYQWVDGSAYVNHVELVRKSRGAEVPSDFYHNPLMYQGGSDSFLGPKEPILVADESFGIDLEAEIAVIVNDVPMGSPPEVTKSKILLMMLVNDVTLRNLTQAELAKGFGFIQSKISSAFSPVAVSLDEVGSAWDGHRLNLQICVDVNGVALGRANAGVDMTFDFPQLISHAAKTRPLVAGTIIGSGTVSNKFKGETGRPLNEGGSGYSCLAEIRSVETIRYGKPITPFLCFGDSVSIWMDDLDGNTIFGSIEQTVLKY